MNKKVFIIVISIFCAVGFYPEFALAAASVSVTVGGSQPLGTKGVSGTGTTGTITVKNDASGGTEDIQISVGNSSSGWVPGATAGLNQFVLKVTDALGAVITGSNIPLVNGLTNNATSNFVLYFVAPSSVNVGANVQQTITVTLTATNWVFSCTNNMTVSHVGGPTAAVTKTVTYGTVLTSLSGASKCWITQNLGATNQATSAIDATEPSAGWYWQFNRKQGFKYHDATGREPGWTWITAINESLSWQAANDPCTILLGAGWRLPTLTEWTNADANGQVGGWDNYNETFADVLKFHASGSLLAADGTITNRGVLGYAWSSDQVTGTSAGFFYAGSGVSVTMNNGDKARAFPVRCLGNF